MPLSAELHYISRKVANLANNEEELRALGLENAAVCDSHGEGHASLRSVRRPFVGSRKKKGKSQNNNNNNVSFAYFGQCLVTHTLFSTFLSTNCTPLFYPLRTTAPSSARSAAATAPTTSQSAPPTPTTSSWTTLAAVTAKVIQKQQQEDSKGGRPPQLPVRRRAAPPTTLCTTSP